MLLFLCVRSSDSDGAFETPESTTPVKTVAPPVPPVEQPEPSTQLLPSTDTSECWSAWPQMTAFKGNSLNWSQHAFYKQFHYKGKVCHSNPIQQVLQKHRNLCETWHRITRKQVKQVTELWLPIIYRCNKEQ